MIMGEINYINHEKSCNSNYIVMMKKHDTLFIKTKRKEKHFTSWKNLAFSQIIVIAIVLISISLLVNLS